MSCISVPDLTFVFNDLCIDDSFDTFPHSSGQVRNEPQTRACHHNEKLNRHRYELAYEYCGDIIKALNPKLGLKSVHVELHGTNGSSVFSRMEVLLNNIGYTVTQRSMVNHEKDCSIPTNTQIIDFIVNRSVKIVRKCAQNYLDSTTPHTSQASASASASASNYDQNRHNDQYKYESNHRREMRSNEGIYVPPHRRNDKAQYVKNPSNEMCEFAIRQNGHNPRYNGNKSSYSTAELCKFAMFFTQNVAKMNNSWGDQFF
jgi:hypothetical protein